VNEKKCAQWDYSRDLVQFTQDKCPAQLDSHPLASKTKRVKIKKLPDVVNFRIKIVKRQLEFHSFIIISPF
jgi:hypothetical protein